MWVYRKRGKNMTEYETLKAYAESLSEDEPADLDKMNRFFLLQKLQKLEDDLHGTEDPKRRVFLKATINRTRTTNGMAEKYKW